MGVILRQPAHARHAAQLAALFIAIHRAKFRQPNWQLAVAVFLRRVNLDVMRAVHRLEQVLLVFIHLDGRVLAVFVKRKVPRLFIKLDAANVRREHRIVSALRQLALHKVLQLHAHDAALGHP